MSPRHHVLAMHDALRLSMHSQNVMPCSIHFWIESFPSPPFHSCTYSSFWDNSVSNLSPFLSIKPHKPSRRHTNWCLPLLLSFATSLVWEGGLLTYIEHYRLGLGFAGRKGLGPYGLCPHRWGVLVTVQEKPSSQRVRVLVWVKLSSHGSARVGTGEALVTGECLWFRRGGYLWWYELWSCCGGLGGSRVIWA